MKATLMCAGLVAVGFAAVGATAWPLKISDNGRYLVDQNGKPFLLHGCSGWSLTVQLSTNDAAVYLEDRALRGFNTIICTIADKYYGDKAPANYYGEQPFSTAGDFTTPNDTYFRTVDAILRKAEQLGIAVLATPLYLGNTDAHGWNAEAASNGPSGCRAYGEFLGQRYRDYGNLIWVVGGDRNPSTAVSAAMDGFAEGILSRDTNHLMTAHALQDEARDRYNRSWLNIDNVYYYRDDLYARCLAELNRTPAMPVFMAESKYENEQSSTPLSLRRQAYWSNLSGSCGQLFGNYPIWRFAAGWQSSLGSPGAVSMTLVRRLFESREWWKLQPDDAHRVVTSGFGSGVGYIASAKAYDGSFMMAYFPGSNTVSVDLTQMGGAAVNEWWYNPRTGEALRGGTMGTEGSAEFSPPGADDWVLVLDDASLGLGPPGDTATGQLQILTASLPEGQVGAQYETALNAGGGTTPYSWELAPGSGAMASGLALRVEGTIEGIPVESGAFPVKVQVTDANHASTAADLVLVVVPAALSVTSGSLGDAQVGIEYLESLEASGGVKPYGWDLSPGSLPLPPGLTLGNSGEIGGIPTAAGTFSFSLRVTDASEAAASRDLSMVVLPAVMVVTTQTLPIGEVGATYAALLGVSGGVPPYMWSLAQGGDLLPLGLSLSSTGNITGVPATEGVFGVTVQVTDDLGATANQTLTLSVVPALLVSTQSLPGGQVGVVLDATLVASGGVMPYAWALAPGSGPLPAGVTLSSSGVLSGTPAESGSFEFTVRVTDDVGVTADQVLTLTVVPALQLSTQSLPGGQVGVAYDTKLAASGGVVPYAWALAPGSGPLPQGVALSTEGLLSGAPTESGSFGFTVRVTDDQGATADQVLKLTVAPALDVNTQSVPGGQEGVAYSAMLALTGGTPPFGWALAPGSGPLPAGVTLSSSGVLSGTPAENGSFEFTVRVTDNMGATADRTLALAVVPALQVSTTSVPYGLVGVPYNATLVASGGTMPYLWLLAPASPPLPASLVLITNGVLSGIPEQAGTNVVMVRVTDGQGATADQALELRVVELQVALMVNSQSVSNILTEGFGFQYAVNAPGTYDVQWSADAMDWQLLRTNLVEAPATVQVVDGAAATVDRRFYRVVRRF